MTWALVIQDKLQQFLPLQRWLWRHGNGLLQMQCSTGFDEAVSA
jgi:hypothetical protein